MKRGSSKRPDSGPISEYEAKRQRNMQANAAHLRSLGIPSLLGDTAAAVAGHDATVTPPPGVENRPTGQLAAKKKMIMTPHGAAESLRICALARVTRRLTLERNHV